MPSQSDVIDKNAYEVINIIFKEPELVLRQRTVGKSDYEGHFITYDNMSGFFSYGIIGFPILQEGKNGTSYAFIFETKGVIPFAEDVGMQLYVYRKEEGSWEYFCVANVGM
ncbi:hypothetical protein [Anditalea andensis]|uniref:Uncharacterized protein n=1 Tax=Anditalea andensis TaxID=1048983 RepID=A0A074LMV7_9BACT|nr:hypothetical protein [Anditalea andensis]KEO75222.1 hypothetical protein EL17_06055 [Anditalea andensis]